jgi:hypothetical protein
MILNSSFGVVEKLPFDLRGHRILQYDMPAESDNRAPERKKLETALKQAVKAIRPRHSLSSEYIKAFENESDRIKKLVDDQPDSWEYLLTVELLKPKIRRARKDYDDTLNGRRYNRSTSKSSKHYLDWIGERLIDLMRLTTITSTVIDEEIVSSWGPDGVAGDALEIKRASDRLIAMCEATIEWENEFCSVHTSDVFDNLRAILKGGSAHIFAAAEHLVQGGVNRPMI